VEPDKKPASSAVAINGPRESANGPRSDRYKWLTSLEYLLETILKNQEPEHATLMLEELLSRLRESGFKIPYAVNTPYINTIPTEKQPRYPGDREIERRIKSYVRWNAMAMVVKANRLHPDIGGHISTYASLATLYEVGLNHFFRGGDNQRLADMVYFQGHASPGIYSRAYIEWRELRDARNAARRRAGDFERPLPVQGGGSWKAAQGAYFRQRTAAARSPASAGDPGPTI
jgi:pyruvate dehydrogenase E1 component